MTGGAHRNGSSVCRVPDTARLAQVSSLGQFTSMLMTLPANNAVGVHCWLRMLSMWRLHAALSDCSRPMHQLQLLVMFSTEMRKLGTDLQVSQQAKKAHRSTTWTR